MRRSTIQADVDDKQVTNDVTSKLTPPIPSQKCTANVQQPDQQAHEQTILTVFTRQHLDKSVSDIAEIYHFLYGDIRQTLASIKNNALNEIEETVAQYVESIKAHPEENICLASYRTAISRALANMLRTQSRGVDCTIESELKAFSSENLHAYTASSIQDYLQAKYDTLVIYKHLAVTLYNGAAAYYRERWLASHNDPIKLKKECEAFNAIFVGITQIQSDFSLSAPQEVLKLLASSTTTEIEKHLTETLKRARQNKLDDANAAYNLFIEELNTFTSHADHPQGRYFSAIESDNKKPSLTFHQVVHDTFQKFLLAKQKFDAILPEHLAFIVDAHHQAKQRVTEFTKHVAESIASDLDAAKRDIDAYHFFLQEEDTLSDAASMLNRQIAGLERRAKQLAVPRQQIDAMNIPELLNHAYRYIFEDGTFGERQNTLNESITAIQQRIDSQRSATKKLQSDFTSSMTSLQIVNASDTVHEVKSAYQQIEHDLAKVETDLIEAERLLHEAIEFFQQIQAARNAFNAALQFSQELLNGNNDIDYYFEDIGKCRPFTQAAHKLSALQQHPLSAQQPPFLQQYVEYALAKNELEKKNTAAILCCHHLLGCALNFHYWQSVRDSNVQSRIDNNSYSIPSAITKIIELAKLPENQNWSHDPESAKHLLAAIQSFAANTKCKSTPLRQYLYAAANPDYVLILSDEEPNIPAHMLMRPQLLVNPQKVMRFERAPTFWERHPTARQVLPKLLWGAAIALAVCAVAAVIAFPVLSALGIIPVMIAAVGGSSALAGITASVVTVVTGIGAGIGAILGKISANRSKQKNAPSRRPPPPIARPIIPANEPSSQAPNPAAEPVIRSQQIISDARISATSTTLFSRPAPEKPIDHKNDFEHLILEHLIECYCGKYNEPNRNTYLRSKILKLWEESKKSMDAFLPALERSHPATGKNVIASAIARARKEYPDVDIATTYSAQSEISKRSDAPPRRSNALNN